MFCKFSKFFDYYIGQPSRQVLLGDRSPHSSLAMSPLGALTVVDTGVPQHHAGARGTELGDFVEAETG